MQPVPPDANKCKYTAGCSVTVTNGAAHMFVWARPPCQTNSDNTDACQDYAHINGPICPELGAGSREGVWAWEQPIKIGVTRLIYPEFDVFFLLRSLVYCVQWWTVVLCYFMSHTHGLSIRIDASCSSLHYPSKDTLIQRLVFIFTTFCTVECRQWPPIWFNDIFAHYWRSLISFMMTSPEMVFQQSWMSSSHIYRCQVSVLYYVNKLKV